MKNDELKTFKFRNWVVRYRLPPGNGPHPVIWLLHGWTGDEDSMWIFASRLPKHYLLLAPRGFFPTPIGGFSWYPINKNKTQPNIIDFHPALEEFQLLMDDWPKSAPSADFSRFRIAGFSQGGALAYAIAIVNPKRIAAIAGLATYLPSGSDAYLKNPQLKNLPIYISHGNKDHLVPVSIARHTVKKFEEAGARVNYCESDVGHKLSAGCFKGMENFFEEE